MKKRKKEGDTVVLAILLTPLLVLTNLTLSTILLPLLPLLLVLLLLLNSIRSKPHLDSHRRTLYPFREPLSDRESVVSVFIGTWNLHGKPVHPHDLYHFIPVNTHDLYVIGTEECEHSIEASFILTSKAKWIALLSQHLTDNYVPIATETLQAIHMIVFLRRTLLPYLSRVSSDCVATGIGDVLGNKGGVGIGLDIGQTSFLFITSHFAAHQQHVQQRNEDYHKINGKMKLRFTN